jgi:hypothetical protein
MAITLYDVSVSSYRQIMDALAGVLDKGLEHAAKMEGGVEGLLAARFAPDMFPFATQIQLCCFHSAGSVGAMLSGAQSIPEGGLPPVDGEALIGAVAMARQVLAEADRDAVNAREGHEVVFGGRGMQLRFKAEDYVLTFALPNLNFHATTAYDLLRSRGVELGKRDYIGALRLMG